MNAKNKAGKLVSYDHLAIDDKCEGCNKVVENEGAKICPKFFEPAIHWENNQICAFASHVKREVKVVKRNVNPLKASKRAAGK